jgi:hypothetical protein
LSMARGSRRAPPPPSSGETAAAAAALAAMRSKGETSGNRRGRERSRGCWGFWSFWSYKCRVGAHFAGFGWKLFVVSAYRYQSLKCMFCTKRFVFLPSKEKYRQICFYFAKFHQSISNNNN